MKTLVIIAVIAFIIMLAIIFSAPKANYGREDRATGMSYERFKKTNGGSI